ncbi:UdgX family uracil-DNA binding protein [Bosea thiooxidans]
MADEPPAAALEARSLEALNAAMVAEAQPVPGVGRVVCGEGPGGAAIAFVGEQPGDQEDRLGRPFVGPAGKLLDRAFAEAGIDRRASYLTNAVKRFHFVERGKRRLHQRPGAGEIRHDRWWLERELALVDPRIVVALGATAIRALAGKPLPIARHRGETRFGDRLGYITAHPSALLRIREDEDRHAAFEVFVADLEIIRRLSLRNTA